MAAFCFPNVMQALQEVWKNSKVHMHQTSPKVGVYIDFRTSWRVLMGLSIK